MPGTAVEGLRGTPQLPSLSPWTEADGPSLVSSTQMASPHLTGETEAGRGGNSQSPRIHVLPYVPMRCYNKQAPPVSCMSLHIQQCPSGRSLELESQSSCLFACFLLLPEQLVGCRSPPSQTPTLWPGASLVPGAGAPSQRRRWSLGAPARKAFPSLRTPSRPRLGLCCPLRPPSAAAPWQGGLQGGWGWGGRPGNRVLRTEGGIWR